MTTIASLPKPDVWLAFNPTYDDTTLVTALLQALPDSGDSNDYWTNVSAYIKEFDTQSGRQHFLDRVEAGTATVTFNNRTGYFFNGGDSEYPTGPDGNGTGYVIDARMPLAITGTWDGVTYPVFKGYTDTVTEDITDVVNTDLSVDCSDLLKYLSLCYMTRSAFWPSYANPDGGSTEAWYRLNTPVTATCTSAIGDGTTITYKALNQFVAGENVTIGGFGVDIGHGLNLTNVVIATASATEFTVTSSFAGTAGGTGLAYRTVVDDELGGTAGNYLLEVAWPTYGAMIYDPDTCVDLSNGTSQGTGVIRFPSFSDMSGLDFWVLGLSMGGSTLADMADGDDLISLNVTVDGFYNVTVLGSGSYTSTINVCDGYWHHVGLIANSSGVLKGYVDGTFFDLDDTATWSASPNLSIGNLGTGGLCGYVDEVIVSNGSSLSTLEDEVKNRFRAGLLLQQGYPVTSTMVQSGDRIAEILCLAGFGSVSGGAVVLPSDFYYINDSDTAWANDADGNGFIPVEPWYWDTPITTSTALDLIGQLTDTDIGSFFQKPDGTAAFYNQLFYGTWDWDASTNTGTWTPNTYTPSASEVWTDNDGDGELIYNYDGATLKMLRDDADVWTMVQVTPQAGTEQIYENVDAEARWGFSTLTKTATLHTTLNLALSTATFLGYLSRSSLPRVGEVVLKSVTRNGGANLGLFVPLGTVVNFIHSTPNASTSGTYPSQQAYVDELMAVESLGHHFDADAGEWTVSYTLDPYAIRS